MLYSSLEVPVSTDILYFRRLPLDFWRILHSEYGIVVYPSAMTEDIEPAGLGVDKTFTEAYAGHIGKYHTMTLVMFQLLMIDAIVMFGRSNGTPHPPPCPFEYLQEPPPVYQKDPS